MKNPEKDIKVFGYMRVGREEQLSSENKEINNTVNNENPMYKEMLDFMKKKEKEIIAERRKKWKKGKTSSIKDLFF